MEKKVLMFSGNEDFATLIRKNAYYVDKTAYLKSLFLSADEVMNPLFIRPRRFGKTLNMNMIKEFCELNYQNPGDKSYQQKLFMDNGRNLKVAGPEYAELREKVMGEYPVISISFKGVEGVNFEGAVSIILGIISGLYNKFKFLIKSSRQDPDDIEDFKAIKTFCKTKRRKLTNEDNLFEAVEICGTFIPILAQMLYQEYQRKVLVIIDEYDVPLQKAVVAKEPYYEEMLDIIRQLSVSTFKQEADPWLYKGIISGCLKIAHQSIFTDANNFTVYGMDREPYTGFFGFTEEETARLFRDCNLEDKAEVQKAKAWYDGYRFGDKHIYCPWSLINYCYDAQRSHSYEPVAFWVNTSGNDLITLFARNSMEAHNEGNLNKLQQLLDGEELTVSLREFTTYPDLRHSMNLEVFLTMLLHTGYLTFAENSKFTGEVTLRIPNEEVRECFGEKVKFLYDEDYNPQWFQNSLQLLDLLMDNQVEKAQSLIGSMLKQFLSIRNSGSELYYHGFLLGVLGPAASSGGFDIESETESGEGYTDIIIKQNSTAAILELKRGENTIKGRLKACEDAKQQILDKDYARGLIAAGYTAVYGLGIGFGGKSCVIESLGNLAANKTKRGSSRKGKTSSRA